MKKHFIIALSLAIVFGLGWGFGLAATSHPIKELTFTFQIVFSLFVGSQGILIFLLHGIRNKDARTLWKQCFIRIGGDSLIDNIVSLTKSSSAAPQSLRGNTLSSGGTVSLSQKKDTHDSDGDKHIFTSIDDAAM